jgi:uncharacterized damage-inducible protein DinB
MTRSFLLIAAAVFSCTLQAQNAATDSNPMSSDLRSRYDYIKTNLIKAAEKMPAEDYSFKPTPEIRNFGQLISHTADVQAFFCSNAAGERKNIGAASKTSKEDLVAALKESFDICDPLYRDVTDAKAASKVSPIRSPTLQLTTLFTTLFYNVTHDNEMYGVIGVYLRLKGIVPPSSENMGRGRGRGRGKQGR